MTYETVRFLDSHRAQSEDRAEIISLADGSAPVLVVADGVGGQANGGPAAEAAVGMVRDAVRGGGAGSGAARRRPQFWYRLLREIDAALDADPEAGQTTLVAVAVTPRRLVGASVGDSEAWWIDSGGHFELTGGQRRKPYLGSGAAEVVPFVLPTPTAPGTLLVATDGLFKYTSPDRILDAVAAPPGSDDAPPDLPAAAKRLGDLARLSSGRLLDDLAVLLCRSEGGGAAPAAGLLVERFRRLTGR